MQCHLRPLIPPVNLGFNSDTLLRQISANSDNPRPSFCNLTNANVGTVRHLIFDHNWILLILRRLSTDNAPTAKFQQNHTMNG